MKGKRGDVMIKRMSVILFCICLCFCGCGRQDDKNMEPDGVSKEVFAMNTYITMTAYGNDADVALDSAEKRIRELESLWSVTDEKSEIYQLNHNDGSPFTVSEPTSELIQFALSMAGKTEGALEPTIYPVLAAWGFTTDSHQIPEQKEIDQLLQTVGYKKVQVQNQEILLPDGMQIDMGAVAKGFTGDQVAEILKDSRIESAIISLGGNIQTIGTKPDGGLWRIGVQSPGGEENFAVLETAECAVVTSGGYQNYFEGEDGTVYHHILDPKTGKSARSGLLSVTVVGKEGKVCDALSTALFVMGEEKAIRYWQENSDFDLILYTEKDKIIITEGLEDKFKLAEEYGNLPVTVQRR